MCAWHVPHSQKGIHPVPGLVRQEFKLQPLCWRLKQREPDETQATPWVHSKSPCSTHYQPPASWNHQMFDSICPLYPLSRGCRKRWKKPPHESCSYLVKHGCSLNWQITDSLISILATSLLVPRHHCEGAVYKGWVMLHAKLDWAGQILVQGRNRLPALSSRV